MDKNFSYNSWKVWFNESRWDYAQHGFMHNKMWWSRWGMKQGRRKEKYICFNIYKSTFSLLNTYVRNKNINLLRIIINTGMDGA